MSPLGRKSVAKAGNHSLSFRDKDDDKDAGDFVQMWSVAC